MALTRSFVRNAAMTPLDARLMNMATLVCNADGSPRTGVLSANPSIVSALATWHFRVQAAEFACSKGKADGVTLPTNDGVVDVPIAAGAPASNSRIDVLWVKHEDNTTGDAASLPIFGVTSGAAAASPVKPAIPTGAEELATLRAYSGTTGASGGANILTNTYRMTAARGGVTPFRTKVELDLWTTATTGQLAFAFDTAILYQWRGAWVVVSGDTGWIALPLLNGWSNFPGAYAPAGYRRVNGVVYLRGEIRGGSLTPGAAMVGPLPVGFRPAFYNVYSGWSNGQAKPIEIGPAGQVVIGDTPPSPFRFSLAQISFPADG